MFLDHIWNPDNCLFVGVSREVAIKHVVSDVDFSVRVPTGKGRILVIKNSIGKIKPLYLSGLFFPELFSKLRSRSPSECLLVLVFFHTIKINMALGLSSPAISLSPILNDGKLRETLPLTKMHPLCTYRVINKVKSLSKVRGLPFWIKEWLTILLNHLLFKIHPIQTQFKILEKLRHCYIHRVWGTS